MEFNVNWKVRVRLTNVGRAILRKQHAAINDFIASRGATPLRGDGIPREDSDGWSEWQLWALMEAFGSEMRLGGPVPFETTIVLMPESSTAVDAVARTVGDTAE